jgi:SAM-dependent methyltransferase
MTNSPSSVQRFDDRADDYVRYRPGYPPGAVDAILDRLGPPGAIRAADIGAGTGISARLLGDRGLQVVAVEPGEVMRRAATGHPHVHWIAAAAEATGLRSQTFDLVLCAQSFHWFRAEEAATEFARILKPGARLAILWNRRSPTDPFTVGYRQAILEVSTDTGVESMSFDPDVITRGGRFSPGDRLQIANPQPLDLDGVIGRARSASYVPKTGPAADRLLVLLRALHAQHADADGFVSLVHDTEVFRWSRNETI